MQALRIQTDGSSSRVVPMGSEVVSWQHSIRIRLTNRAFNTSLTLRCKVDAVTCCEQRPSQSRRFVVASHQQRQGVD
jgi:hypothetical protein